MCGGGGGGKKRGDVRAVGGDGDMGWVYGYEEGTDN